MKKRLIRCRPALEREAELKADVVRLKEELTRDWQARLQKLLALI